MTGKYFLLRKKGAFMKNNLLYSKMIDFIETFDLDSIEFISAQAPRRGIDIYHTHDFFEINYSNRGRSRFKIEEQEFEFRPFDFVIIPPGANHGSRLYAKSEDNILIIWLKMKADMGKKVIININDKNQVFHWLCNEIQRQSELEKELKGELIHTYLKASLLQARQYLLHSSEYESMDVVGFAIRYIHDNIYMPDLNIGSISSLLNLSPEYFSRLFKKKTNVSPGAFINLCKINEAKKLLTSGSFTMNEIAYALGYMNQFYFSKQFKQITGVTPSEYKRQNMEEKFH
jgi:AraC-like DNA-binding protein/mannose-6-phosphate isomerase-like protein (cupin superfamily)